MIWYLAGQYTEDGRNIESILNNLRGKISPDTFSHIECILTTGAPVKFFGESSYENFLNCWRYSNHKSILNNKTKIEKVMNKEDKTQILNPTSLLA